MGKGQNFKNIHFCTTELVALLEDIEESGGQQNPLAQSQIQISTILYFLLSN